MSWLLVERPYGGEYADQPSSEDAVECSSLSFDGGSLICFTDESQTAVKAAYGPGGWLRARWAKDGEIHS